MKLLGLDVGDRRIGVAISELEGFVFPLTVLPQAPDGLAAVAQLAREREIDRIVVGLPISLDGTLGPQARKVQQFARRLHRQLPGVDIVTQDERFTSVEAIEVLLERDVSRARRRRLVDQLAAANILQSYLESEKPAR